MKTLVDLKNKQTNLNVDLNVKMNKDRNFWSHCNYFIEILDHLYLFQSPIVSPHVHPQNSTFKKLSFLLLLPLTTSCLPVVLKVFPWIAEM